MSSSFHDPLEEWTLAHASKAYHQGWGVFDGYELQLQRDDDLNVFATDEDAWVLVVDRAQRGDATCASALHLLAALSPAEHGRIIKPNNERSSIMSEPIWTTASVKVPRCWLRGEGGKIPLCLEPLWNYLGEDIDIQADEADPAAVIVTIQGEANYGWCGVEEFVEELRNWRIPIRVAEDPKYEYDGEVRLYRGDVDADGTPGSYLHGLTNGEGSMVLDRCTWRSIIDGQHPWASTPEEYFDPPTLESCSISHLGATPPSDDDEED